MGHSDKAAAVAHYGALAAEAARQVARAKLIQQTFTEMLPIPERLRRFSDPSKLNPATLHVQHKGAWWDVRMECDSFDGDRGPKATDWWLSAVRIDGVWFDAQDTLAPSFLLELEHAARVMPE